MCSWARERCADGHAGVALAGVEQAFEVRSALTRQVDSPWLSATFRECAGAHAGRNASHSYPCGPMTEPEPAVPVDQKALAEAGTIRRSSSGASMRRGLTLEADCRT
jgi:hypothetical protein